MFPGLLHLPQFSLSHLYSHTALVGNKQGILLARNICDLLFYFQNLGGRLHSNSMRWVSNLLIALEKLKLAEESAFKINHFSNLTLIKMQQIFSFKSRWSCSAKNILRHKIRETINRANMHYMYQLPVILHICDERVNSWGFWFRIFLQVFQCLRGFRFKMGGTLRRAEETGPEELEGDFLLLQALDWAGQGELL